MSGIVKTDEVHVWWARTDTFSTTIDEVRDVLAPDEIRRHDSYHFGRDRTLYLATRVLCRWTLGRFAAIDPAALVFESDEHGRPTIVGPPDARSFTFNLSNTTGMVVIAVGSGRSVGVDVECLERLDEMLSIGERMFAAEEWKELLRCPAPVRAERFATYWTLKEAYGKARGIGLGVPFDAVVFELAGEDVRVRFDAGTDDDPSRWRFVRVAPTENHRIAVALGRAPAEAVRVAVREIDLDAMARARGESGD